MPQLLLWLTYDILAFYQNLGVLLLLDRPAVNLEHGARARPLQDPNFGPAWLNLGFAGISNFNREPCHAESTAINFFLFISYFISLLN